MRGSMQAAGRKPVPNNRGKWRNWKKTQRQHSQHRWFSAEQHDSWEKGPQCSAENPQLCPRAVPANNLGMGVPAEWDLVGGHHVEREPQAMPLCLKLWVLAAGHKGARPSWGWVGGCPPSACP